MIDKCDPGSDEMLITSGVTGNRGDRRIEVPQSSLAYHPEVDYRGHLGTRSSIQAFIHLLIFFHAIDEINQSPDILPNITLGWHALDSCVDTRMAISFGATDYSLTNRYVYPHVFRTVQNERIHSKIIVAMLKYFGWTWVGVVVSDDDSGENALHTLTKFMADNGLCAAFIIKLISSISSSHDLSTSKTLQNSNIGVLIMCGSYSVLCFQFFVNYEIELIDKTFIYPPSWTSSSMNEESNFPEVNCSLAIELSVQRTIKAEDVFNSVQKYPQIAHLLNCTLFQQSMSLGVHGSTFYAVNYISGENKTGEIIEPNINKFLSSGVGPYVYYAVELKQYIKEVKHSLESMSSFDESGEHIGHFKITNKVLIDRFNRLDVEVGNFTPWATEGQELQINSEAITWKHNHQVDCSSVLKNNLELWRLGLSLGNERRCPLLVVTDLWQTLATAWKPNTVNFSQVKWRVMGTMVHEKLNAKSNAIHSKFLQAMTFMVPVSKCSEHCLPGSRKKQRSTIYPCCYDCVPCSEGEMSNNTDSVDCTRCQDDQWSNDKRDRCVQKIVEFISFEKDTLASVISSVTITCCVVTGLILLLFAYYQDTPIVKANNRNLSYVLLVSIMLSFLCVFLFLGRPVDVTCMLRVTSFGVIFSVAVSSLLAKSIMVCIAFNATKPGSPWRKWMGSRLPNSIMCMFSMVQVIICVTWLSISPPFQDKDTHSYQGKIIIQCNEGSVIGFYTVLGYMGLLAAVSFIIAFLARTLPDSFNEAKYITFSMLVFCSVWIATIPAYLSTKGKDMVAVEIFSIMASSAGLLGCIFFPKCYIILFRRENNRKQIILHK
ncbi:vomeronasal type-2 receptor 26-like [Mantella aurantiaca]